MFEDQISCADIILLSKADLAGEDGLAKARAVIEAEAPRTLPTLPMTDGVIDPRVVLGLEAAAKMTWTRARRTMTAMTTTSMTISKAS